jgi:quaternary ammonium compound-resistance protein SugE
MNAFAWPLLIVAGLKEPMWVYTMGRSADFRNVPWSLATVAIVVADVYLLSLAMTTVGASMSYAVWTGIGAVFTFLTGVVVYREQVRPVRVALIMVIIAGIVGLNLTSGGA